MAVGALVGWRGRPVRAAAAILACLVSGVIGIYAMIAYAFPTHLPATGTGFAGGLGRGGSVLSPIIAGALFQAGLGLPIVATVMACGSLIALAALYAIRLPAEHIAGRVADRSGDRSATVVRN